MMTKEEVASIVKYCNDNSVSYKARLSELGFPEWRFFESKRHYAKEQASSASSSGEFLQLTAGGDFVPIPAFAAKTVRGVLKEELTGSKDDKRGAAHPERNDDAYPRRTRQRVPTVNNPNVERPCLV